MTHGDDSRRIVGYSNPVAVFGGHALLLQDSKLYNGGMGEDAKKLAIVGGGAAGLAAAIVAGERARAIGVPLDVVVLERDDRVGRSILATGNGRCNFSNEHPHADDYHNGDFVGGAFGALLSSVTETASDRDLKIIRDNGHVVNAFFYKHGLVWRVEDDGRQYPRTNKASTVVDVLRRAARNVGVREACEREVAAIDPPRGPGGQFTLRMADGMLERADSVIVACGGKALAVLGTCGLPVVAQRPMLGPLRCAETAETRELDNIRVRCDVSLVRKGERVAGERGELMFRKYGVSGICVFNLSRFAQAGDTLRIDFLQSGTLDDAVHYLYARRKLLAGTFGDGVTCEDMTCGLLLPRVADVVLKRVGMAAGDRFEKADVERLARVLSAFDLTVEGMGDETICQVRRGGLDVGAFDHAAMEAKELPGLYAAGEALDVDGPCGGYNLHWAWSSGMLAGRSAAERLLQPLESGLREVAPARRGEGVR